MVPAIDFPCALDYTLLMLARAYSAAVIGPAGVMEEIDTAKWLLATDSMDPPEEAVHEDRPRVQFAAFYE